MIWEEVVCHVKCPHKECKHHKCHLPTNGFYMGRMVSEIEYEVKNLPKDGKCPYSERWIKGKGLA